MLNISAKTERELRRLSMELNFRDSDLIYRVLRKYINDQYRILAVSTLPHPIDGHPVPVIHISK